MLAFTFPGQGSQRPGMGRQWADHPSWELVAEASEVAGRDVERLLLEADAEELRHTRNSQLATYVLSLVALDAVERTGLAPAACAGHSLGEYTALTATGALSFSDGVRLVAARGEAMQDAGEEHPGTMAAVLGLADDDADAACRRAEGDVWVANFNAPGQVVIAGSEDAVARAGAVAKELGAKRVMALPVGGAFHTPYMAPARDRLRKAIDQATLRAPDVAVVANIDARPHTDADEWPALLSGQLCNPVRWRHSVQRLVDDGVDTLIEIGPGTVLSGMAKRIVPGIRPLSVASPADLDALLEALSGEPPVALGELEGEHLHVHERLVVSPGPGVFQPAAGWRDPTPGTRVEVGELLGSVGGHDVRSLFAGQLMAMVAVEGERVTASQPVAWLRVP